MQKLTDAWFSFKGTRSDSLGIYMTQMPVRHLPRKNVALIKVAGRSGSVRISDGSYEDINISISFKVFDTTKLSQIDTLLTGSGQLIFSDDQTHAYNAVIDMDNTRRSTHYRYDAQTYDVTFTCDPTKTLVTPAANIVVTTSGTLSSNPGTAPALPRVAIVGSGDFSVTIGQQTIYFTGVATGVIVDSELGDVLTSDGTLLANDKADGELWSIPPGSFAVSWAEGGSDDEGNTTSGSVTSITITPRWRYL